MSQGNEKDLKNWVQAWTRASKELEKIRRREIREANTAQAIEALASAFRWALRDIPPRLTSGLIEQQRLFSKLRDS